MKTYIVNTKDCKSIDEVHIAIANVLNFPDYYGKNLDALSDCLDEIDVPAKLNWVEFAETRKKLGKKIDEIAGVIEENKIIIIKS